MQLIATDTPNDLAAMLEAYEHPAILLTPDYQIVACNQHYINNFGDIDISQPAYCYQVSHHYDVPCDQAGEACPLTDASRSGKKQRVLHVHQTATGREHIDVELLPIIDKHGKAKFFVELLKPVTFASPKTDGNDMVGASPCFNDMIEKISRVGPNEISVLLLGESGTGKEMTALAIHQASPRSHKPMVTLECAGITESLFESELFGHVKGAFTGAIYSKQGLVEKADGGTLFLDEIGDIPLELQVKLLRLIEAGTYRTVGSRETKRADFRLICATHKDIFSMVERGEFRRDLYYRINVFPIYLPSLNDRKDDIALLAKTIIKKIDNNDKHVITDSAISALKQHYFLGNIRELRNILSRALVLTNTPIIDQHVIKRCLEIDRATPQSPTQISDLKSNENDYLQRLMAHCQGDKEKAATLAGISLRSLYRKLQQAPQ